MTRCSAVKAVVLIVKCAVVEGLYFTYCFVVCVCVDLAEQIAKAGDFRLQVFGLDHQLVADGLGLPLRVQREDQL